MFVQRVNGHKTLRVLRDDLYPFLGGGNKGRKAVYIEREAIARGYNSLVTTGGIHSNHCRAIAVLAAMRGWKCTLVLHGSEEEFFRSTGNPRLMRESGATVHFAEPTCISDVMERAVRDDRENGWRPFYVPGGGHSLEGGLAYVDAVAELKRYCEINEWQPSHIFIASGTGSTQAGIMAGLERNGLSRIRVVGISVARPRGRAENIVHGLYRELCAHLRISPGERKAEVVDDFICGGYEQFNDEVKMISEASLRTYGFVLDTTYTAKAFWGMNEYIRGNTPSGDVLFWHTGGILNFLSQQR